MVLVIINIFCCRSYKVKYKSVEEGSKAEEFHVGSDEDDSSSVSLNIQVSSGNFLSDLFHDIPRTV